MVPRTTALRCAGFMAMAVAVILPLRRQADAAIPLTSPQQSAVAPAPAEQSSSIARGQELYQQKCSLCHGEDRTGRPPVFPTLIGVSKKYSDAEIRKQIHDGMGRMPGFPQLSDDDVAALLVYIRQPPAGEQQSSDAPKQMIRAGQQAPAAIY